MLENETTSENENDEHITGKKNNSINELTIIDFVFLSTETPNNQIITYMLNLYLLHI